MKIAFVASYYNEVDTIKEQLREKKVSNIDVFGYGSNPKGYDIVQFGVRPNKKYGEFLDLSQSISLHGFPEEEYLPPVRSVLSEQNKKLIEEATRALRFDHMDITLNDNNKPEIITREKYDLKIQEIKANKKKLTNMTTKEISAKMELEHDPMIIIAMIAVLFDKIHNIDMPDQYGRPGRGYKAKNNKNVVNFVNGDSIGWIAELWVEKLPLQDSYYRHKYLKALRTRGKNMLKEKASIWGLRFFIEWLIEQDKQEEEEATEPETSGYEVVYEGIDINEDEIPF